MRLAALVALVMLAAGARPARAQADLSFRDTPLEEALLALSEATGLEVVFATRLVGTLRVTGRYSTDDPDRTLRLLLRGTLLRAERLRAGQYVLIAVPPTVAAGVDDPKAYTGTLEGRVVDAETGAGLGGAHVWLVDLGLGDVVDPGGAFFVPDLPAGRYTVRVSHVGYRPVRVELDVFPDSPRLPPTVRLSPEPVASAEAAIVAGPDDADPTPALTDLDARDPADGAVAFGDGDLGAALSWLPGLRRAAGAAGLLSVRGADPAQTRTLRDGVPVHEPWHAFGGVSVLQPETLARVRFYRGTLPAPLGGALAGVLDVETTDALAGDTVATASVSPLAARAAADVAVGTRAGLHVGLRRSLFGLLWRPRLRAEPAAGGGRLVLDPFGGRGARAGLAFTDAEAKLSLRLGPRVRLDASAFGTDDGVDARLDAPASTRPDRLAYRWRSAAGSVRARALLGERTFVTAVGYHAAHGTSERRDGGAAPRETRQTLGETGMWLDVDHYLSARHQLQGGIAVAARRLASSTGRVQPADLALYAMDTWAPAKAWQVQGGLRAEAVADGGRLRHASLSPRLSARWTPAEDRLTFRAALGRQTQTLHRLRAVAPDGQALASARWLAAGEAVAPAVLWQGGAGAEWAVHPTVAVALDGYVRRGRAVREGIAGTAGAEPDADPAALAARFPPLAHRAWGVEGAARWGSGRWTVGWTGAAARTQVRPPGRPWQDGAYHRPWATSLLAERRHTRLALGVRLDAEAGAPAADGRRSTPDVRSVLAVGVRHAARGVDWHLFAQATVRLAGTAPGTASGDAAWPLVIDARGVPRGPLVSLTARW